MGRVYAEDGITEHGLLITFSVQADVVKSIESVLKEIFGSDTVVELYQV